MSERTLIRGGYVLTLGLRTANLSEGDVLIEGTRISEVGPGLRARGAETVEAGEAIIMPGFVDTHRHLWKSLFRNFGEAVASGGAPPAPSSYGPHYSPDDVYAATLVGLLGAAEAGMTTVVDWADLPTGREFADAALQAHAEAGVRTVFALASPEWSGSPHEVLPTLADLAKVAREGLSTLALGGSDPRGSDPDRARREWGVARSQGLRIHCHAGTDPADSGTLAGLSGDLGEDVTLVHCSFLEAADLDAIASAKARVALAPASEMSIGLGAPPIQGLIDRGIRPGLGVDQDALAPGDLFAAMRAANSIQHATLFDLKLAGKAGIPSLLSTREVIRFATWDGASAVGLGDVTGSIEPGKQADIVVLRTDRPNIHPINDPIGAVVWGMDTSNIDWVFVGGHAVVREGELAAGSGNARELAVAAQRRVAEAAGLAVSVGGA